MKVAPIVLKIGVAFGFVGGCAFGLSWCRGGGSFDVDGIGIGAIGGVVVAVVCPRVWVGGPLILAIVIYIYLKFGREGWVGGWGSVRFRWKREQGNTMSLL